MSWYGYGWKPYVPVAERRAKAQKKLDKLRKSGVEIKPVSVNGNKIARTFWGKAWCRHLESFSDYANRLPRGRTYVRNGSVCHLEIAEGSVNAMVIGSELYNVEVRIKTLPPARWKKVKSSCAGGIGSVLELLQGKLSANVMTVVTDRDNGLFPQPKEISMQCSCPDWATMCKHVAAVLYGVGARLDESPELLFLLRGVDHEELIGAQIKIPGTQAVGSGGKRRIADDALADVFGIEIDQPQQKSGSEPHEGRPVPTRKRPLSAQDVIRLRARLALSKADFARLLGVSSATVGKWEKTSGALNLYSRTAAELAAAKKLTKAQARRKLEELV